jgi:two-component system cell cycle response regulator CtrA
MPQTVLVIDDDPVTTDHFARILRLDGYHVIAVCSEPEGLQKAFVARPDAIVVDLRMPLMDGAFLLEQFRDSANLRDVPVVIVTGDYFLDEPMLARLHSLGAEIRFKPMWVEDLLGVIHTVLPGPPPSRVRSAVVAHAEAAYRESCPAC